MRIDEKHNACDNSMYRERMIDVLKRQIAMCVVDKKMRLQKAGNGRRLHLMDRSLFSTL